MMSPGSGDLPVGQFDAQNLLPKGRGMPSFASSVEAVVNVYVAGRALRNRGILPWLMRAAAKV